jgi:hypothetical protein
MTHNVGKIDRVIRLILAAGLAALFFFDLISGTLAYVAIGAAFILLVSTTRRCCPLYAIVGFGTCSNNTKKSEKRIQTKSLKI